MAGLPIAFTGPMVRALLAGTKTQTRRLIRLPGTTHSGGPIYERRDMGGWEATTHGGHGVFRIGRNGERVAVPEEAGLWHRTTGVSVSLPIKVGDRLYVREHWNTDTRNNGVAPRNLATSEPVWYLADDGRMNVTEWSLRSSQHRKAMHMPRWASRITLTVTDVRVERLQDISEADALAEGMTQETADAIMSPEELAVYASTHILCPDARGRILYETVWNSLNGPGSWETNPWVAAYTFTVALGNIDRMQQELNDGQ